MNFLLKLLLTILILLAGYDCMVYALRLLNRPSDSAVYLGTGCLLALFLFLPFALWRFWRSSL